MFLIAAQSRSWLMKIGGVVCIALPHAIGAPAAIGDTVVPVQLVRQFMIASLAANAVFWLTLGVIGGLIYDRQSNNL
jgi:predicted cobalt transporter CbtA